MKFGKTFEQSLVEEKIPEPWIASAIQYKTLKKQIKTVVQEIDSKGLSEQLNSEHLHYVFENHDGQLDKSLLDESDHSRSLALRSDDLFFQNLFNQSCQLTELQKTEERRLLESIKQFSALILELTNSSKDKYKWREIFNLYVEFKLNLNTHFNKGTLRQFLTHVQKQSLSFNKKHKKFFQSFVELNYQLIQFQSFQNLNSIAITKILKKFNKNTLLDPCDIRHLVVPSSMTIRTNTMEQVISTDIIKLIPQVDDYSCPICFQLAYKPIRLQCHHFFCLRCMIQLQRRGETKCPICRDPTVMLADENSVDEELIQVMKKEFPRELKLKKKQNDKESADEVIKELYGRSDDKCVVM